MLKSQQNVYHKKTIEIPLVSESQLTPFVAPSQLGSQPLLPHQSVLLFRIRREIYRDKLRCKILVNMRTIQKVKTLLDININALSTRHTNDTNKNAITQDNIIPQA